MDTQNYVVYYRVSTKDQAESELGLKAQRTDVERFIARTGGTVLCEFKETESGKKTNRPALLGAINEAKKAGARLLISKLDRLSRNAPFTLMLMETGVKFTAVDMPDANELTISIMAVIADQERKTISARTKAGLAEKAKDLAKEGKKLGNPDIASHAKKGNEVRNANRVSGETANTEVLGLILLKRGEHKTFAKIADELNKANKRSTYGKEFTEDNVRVIYNQVVTAISKRAA